MASAKKRPVAIDDGKGRKIQAVRKGTDKIDKDKKYVKLADKRPHSERYNVTLEKLQAIAERIKSGK
jgi:hypothetical protein